MLRGIEYHNSKGHLLGIGYNDKFNPILKRYNIVDGINTIHDYEGLAIPAHILNTNVGGIDENTFKEISNKVDAIESFNSQCLHFPPFSVSVYIRAQELASEYKVPHIYSADAHRVNHVGQAGVMFHKLNKTSGERLVESMRTSLKEDEYTNYGSVITLSEFLSIYFLSRLKSRKESYEIILYLLRHLTKRNTYVSFQKGN